LIRILDVKTESLLRSPFSLYVLTGARGPWPCFSLFSWCQRRRHSRLRILVLSRCIWENEAFPTLRPPHACHDPMMLRKGLKYKSVKTATTCSCDRFLTRPNSPAFELFHFHLSTSSRHAVYGTSRLVKPQTLTS
jgi:hypothetical protein